jgi:hypothetical protein
VEQAEHTPFALCPLPQDLTGPMGEARHARLLHDLRMRQMLRHENICAPVIHCHETEGE